MQAEKLLYVTNMSQPSFSAVERLLSLRTLGLQEVIFLHENNVDGWERRLAEHELNSKTVIPEGSLATSILSVAHRESVSLIAANLNRGPRRILRGSLTTRLLRGSEVPVLILPESPESSASGQDAMFSHVIFATDWSPVSEKALVYLLNYKSIIKELEIVHVIHKKPSVRDMRTLKERLSQTRKIFMDEGIDAEAHVYAGKPSEEIMLAARDYSASCIVMATTGMWTLKDIFFNSCSYRVAEASVVPTLIVP